MRGHKSSSSRQVRIDDPDSQAADGHESEPTTFEDSMPRPAQHASTASLAERRQRSTPAPIHVEDARRFIKATPQRARMENVPDVVSPLNPREMYNAGRGHESQSSFYPSEPSEHHSSQQPDPLNIHRSQDLNVPSTPCNPFQPYGEWLENPQHHKASQARMVGVSPPKQPRRSKSTFDGLKNGNRDNPAPPKSEAQDVEMTDTPAFSPFPYYFRGEDFPSEKRGQKTMIGEKGWLERTDQSPDKVKKGAVKKIGFLDGIKKIAKDMVRALYHLLQSVRLTSPRLTSTTQVVVRTTLT